MDRLCPCCFLPACSDAQNTRSCCRQLPPALFTKSAVRTHSISDELPTTHCSVCPYGLGTNVLHPSCLLLLTAAYCCLLLPAAVIHHRYQSSPYGSTTQSVNGHQPRIALPVREAVEQQVTRIMKALLLGSPGEGLLYHSQQLALVVLSRQLLIARCTLGTSKQTATYQTWQNPRMLRSRLLIVSLAASDCSLSQCYSSNSMRLSIVHMPHAPCYCLCVSHLGVSHRSQAHHIHCSSIWGSGRHIPQVKVCGHRGRGADTHLKWVVVCINILLFCGQAVFIPGCARVTVCMPLHAEYVCQVEGQGH